MLLGISGFYGRNRNISGSVNLGNEEIPDVYDEIEDFIDRTDFVEENFYTEIPIEMMDKLAQDVLYSQEMKSIDWEHYGWLIVSYTIATALTKKYSDWKAFFIGLGLALLNDMIEDIVRNQEEAENNWAFSNWDWLYNEVYEYLREFGYFCPAEADATNVWIWQ